MPMEDGRNTLMPSVIVSLATACPKPSLISQHERYSGMTDGGRSGRDGNSASAGFLASGECPFLRGSSFSPHVSSKLSATSHAGTFVFLRDISIPPAMSDTKGL
jgi:hypothetical protein